MTPFSIYTDGGCIGNPGPGGWGAVILGADESDCVELHGGEPDTTNNRMELTAAIKALESLPDRAVAVVWTDSQYVRNGITAWLARWKLNGWRTASRAPVKNADLWRRLDAENARLRIQWKWVAGHTGVAGNERADQLARTGCREAMERAASSPSEERPR